MFFFYNTTHKYAMFDKYALLNNAYDRLVIQWQTK